MIAVDTSALVAILEGENDAATYAEILEHEGQVLLSAATYVELCAVMSKKRGQACADDIDAFLTIAQIEIEPLTQKQAKIASDAYSRYSVLNLGDSYSYSLAKDKKIPLLFKGNDFTETDLESVS